MTDTLVARVEVLIEDMNALRSGLAEATDPEAPALQRALARSAAVLGEYLITRETREALRKFAAAVAGRE